MLRSTRLLTFVGNLAAFAICAAFAFTRNIHALFYHFDGSYMLVDVRNQLKYGQPVFEFANNFLQSIGNIQFLQNAKLLVFFWPIEWFGDSQPGEVGVYLIIAAIVFVSAYGLARLLAQSDAVALAAGWILGFVTIAFVPRLFFYEILNVVPYYVVIVAAPIVTFWLVGLAGRSPRTFPADAGIALGLIALAFYVLAAAPILLPMVALGTVPYVVLALVLAERRSELWRKTAVLGAALFVMTVLRWPWYVLGLFLDTAPNLFPEDFSASYNQLVSASIFFQKDQFGWAGPLVVIFSAVGAVLSLRTGDFKLRAAAWILLALITTFIGSAVAVTKIPHWIFPPPVYFEVAAWPLYGVFCGVTLVRAAGFIVERMTHAKLKIGYPVRPRVFLLGVAIGFAAILVLRKHPTAIGYPFPPQLSPVVRILKTNIALDPDASFKGRVLTVMPIKIDGGDAWLQQFFASADWARISGNDEMTLGLWYYRIPTLFEYNQFTSPAFHAVVKRALQRPPIAHQRNITVLTYPNAPVLKLLGVRYVLMPQPDVSLGELRAWENRDGEQWDLVELAEPNLATYSPTSIETRRDLASTLDFIVKSGVDLSKQAVASEEIGGPLVPVQSSTLSMAEEDLHVVAESDGRSVVIVPLEFSHCIELHEMHPGDGNGPSLVRIDGLLTGLVFDRHVDAVLSFRIGPLHNPLCRWRDYQELQSMLR
jgi:hypothetical protein